MSRLSLLLYALISYLLFGAAILYGIGFVGNIVVPKGIDDGPPTPLATALAVDVLLLGMFAVQHNLMARPWFKERWTKIVPRPIERATFVAAASLLLLLLYWQWRPIPEVVWQIDNAVGRGVLWVLYFAGWGTVLFSSFLIDHWELFGLKQAYIHYQGREQQSAPFVVRSLYRWVRHPLMVGFLLAFWSAPTMTWGRLVFAGVTTVWIVFSIFLEERDLAHFLGDPYVEYRARTPMLLPRPPRR